MHIEIRMHLKSGQIGQQCILISVVVVGVIVANVSHQRSGWNENKIDAQSTRPFAPLFDRLLAPLTHLLTRALHCAHLFARSLTLALAHYVAQGKEVSVYELNAPISYNFNP